MYNTCTKLYDTEESFQITAEINLELMQNSGANDSSAIALCFLASILSKWTQIDDHLWIIYDDHIHLICPKFIKEGVSLHLQGCGPKA